MQQHRSVRSGASECTQRGGHRLAARRGRQTSSWRETNNNNKNKVLRDGLHRSGLDDENAFCLEAVEKRPLRRRARFAVFLLLLLPLLVVGLFRMACTSDAGVLCTFSSAGTPSPSARVCLSVLASLLRNLSPNRPIGGGVFSDRNRNLCLCAIAKIDSWNTKILSLMYDRNRNLCLGWLWQL